MYIRTYIPYATVPPVWSLRTIRFFLEGKKRKEYFQEGPFKIMEIITTKYIPTTRCQMLDATMLLLLLLLLPYTTALLLLLLLLKYYHTVSSTHERRMQAFVFHHLSRNCVCVCERERERRKSSLRFPNRGAYNYNGPIFLLLLSDRI